MVRKVCSWITSGFIVGAFNFVAPVAAQSTAYPNDPFFAHQWNLHNTGQNGGTPGADIHALEAWSLSRCSPNVTIAILDTGVDPNQEDLQSKLVTGASFVTGAPTTDDDNGHGTMVAGVAGAATDNGKGIAGVCPLGKIMPVKVANAGGHTDDAQVAAGMRWAVDHGARVLSLSLGTEDIPQMRDAASYAYDHGAVVVAASLGGGAIYPADYAHVIAVGGSDNTDHAVDGSAHVSKDLVLAPDSNILTTTRDYPGYDVFCTCVSIATPHVAGVAALILSLRPDLTVDQVVHAIEQGADAVPGQSGFNAIDGYGRINAFRSLEIARDLPSGGPPATPGPTTVPVPPTAAPIPLELHTTLLHKRLSAGSKQRLTILSTPKAHVDVRVTYANFAHLYHSGLVNTRGTYRFTWKTARSKGVADVLVGVSTPDGRHRESTLHFFIR